MLLIMNSFIINALRKRLNKFRNQNVVTLGQEPRQSQGQGQCQGQIQGQIRYEDQSSAAKASEINVYVTLLLVTFAFLILTTPGTIILLYIVQVDIDTSPKAYANFFFLESFTEKLYYTNCGINFFLYVISGRKFRKDLLNLFKCRNFQNKEPSKFSNVNTISSVVEEK